MRLKPMALFIVMALAFVVINLGNACAPGFKLEEPVSSASLSSSCQKDESTNTALLGKTFRTGYLGDRPVSYYDRGDGYFVVEGDKLIRSSKPLPSKPLPPGTSAGVGVYQPGSKWPSGRIPYAIASNLTISSRVQTAINYWNTALAGTIQLVPRTASDSDYAYFVAATSGCAAVVGYQAGSGAHNVELSSDCGEGNVAHEIGHIVGLDHEQNRPDRDSYVTINLANVESNLRQNFSINPSHISYLTYDFGSIMHYSLTAFSINGNPTIVPKVSVPAGVTIGQRSQLSSGDIASVRAMYQSSTPSPTPTPTPRPDGDPDPTSDSSGLRGVYYGDLNFGRVVDQVRDAVIDFNWGATPPLATQQVGQFSIQWVGELVPPASGEYVLSIRVEGGVQLFLQDQSLIDSLDSTGYRVFNSKTVNLFRGRSYPIKISFKSKAAPASIRFLWSRDGSALELVPSSALTPNGLLNLGNGVCTN